MTTDPQPPAPISDEDRARLIDSARYEPEFAVYNSQRILALDARLSQAERERDEIRAKALQNINNLKRGQQTLMQERDAAIASAERSEQQIANFLTYGQGGASFQEAQWLDRLRAMEERAEAAEAKLRCASGEDGHEHGPAAYCKLCFDATVDLADDDRDQAHQHYVRCAKERDELAGAVRRLAGAVGVVHAGVGSVSAEDEATAHDTARAILADPVVRRVMTS